MFMNTIQEDFISAIKKGDRAKVEELLAADGNLSGTNQDGLSAVLTAMYYGQSGIARLLVQRGAPLSLFEAAAVGDLPTVQRAIQQDPQSANAFAPDGFQPLGLAAFFGNIEVAEFLLAHGADPNTASQNGLHVQPLNSAAAGMHLEIARALLAHGADPNARQEGNFTPLHSAAQNGQIEMLQLLLDAGADPMAANDKGDTPLSLAQEQGHSAVVKMLKQRMAG
jgi:ankyrin repeat protein